MKDITYCMVYATSNEIRISVIMINGPIERVSFLVSYNKLLINNIII